MITLMANVDFFVLVVITLLGSLITIKTTIKIIGYLLNKFSRRSQKI